MTASRSHAPALLILVILLQAVSAAIFLFDGGSEYLMQLGVNVGSGHGETGASLELLAALGLIAAIVYETRFLMQLLRRQAHLERQVTVAAQAFHEVVDARFIDWGLTPAERDVAHFTVKGCSIPQTARLRSSAEGTVKSHLGAIYRKAGVSNRGELLSLLIEDLVSPDPAAPDAADTPAPALPRGA